MRRVDKLDDGGDLKVALPAGLLDAALPCSETLGRFDTADKGELWVVLFFSERFKL